MSKTIIDIHVLQTVPPSNINRDDTGSPKQAQYGGVARSRVSSQAWKRATRKAFEETLDPAELGVRTKRIVELIAGKITRQRVDLADDSLTIAEKALKKGGFVVEKPRPAKGSTTEPVAESKFLLFLSDQQISNIASLAIEGNDGGEFDGSAIKKAADQAHSVDLALFGRMVADAVDLNVDAAAQVAHAISVHAVENEFDYFTAVDDKKPDDASGAGMIGTVEFNSSTLYRYATVNVNGLLSNLGSVDATSRAVGAFVHAFITSMPTGKQNTFANRTLPEGVVVVVRDSQSVNLVGAFEDAVAAGEGESRVQIASEKLADYATEIERNYGVGSVASYVLQVGPYTRGLIALGTPTSLSDMVTALESLTSERLQEPA
ncbi:type I-E CRISPR-associated protein Cas7/Cse4/CasC [Compostimonas suwonensis]|uniref:CRISPR system Cascade subunit CasC n=1 Tax=Compostimonas suwonensis TaxID=1048394 RepID=A0A2M9C3S7_9MICO|nr:type I-E CRISPR-associated protein Cas7/Cse4/CasC [Compostimonas suwonensis]PJJ65184.1 CRISPR system Cascade subunit CasC [Compostimonas suwonensis]